MATNFDKALYQAPMGLDALADEPAIEIEVVNPEEMTIDMDGLQISLTDEDESEEDFDENLAEELDEGYLDSLASELIGDVDRVRTVRDLLRIQRANGAIRHHIARRNIQRNGKVDRRTVRRIRMLLSADAEVHGVIARKPAAHQNHLRSDATRGRRNRVQYNSIGSRARNIHRSGRGVGEAVLARDCERDRVRAVGEVCVRERERLRAALIRCLRGRCIRPAVHA